MKALNSQTAAKAVRPEDLLLMYLTGSMSSIVPPAVIKIFFPDNEVVLCDDRTCII